MNQVAVCSRSRTLFDPSWRMAQDARSPKNIIQDVPLPGKTNSRVLALGGSGTDGAGQLARRDCVRGSFLCGGAEHSQYPRSIRIQPQRTPTDGRGSMLRQKRRFEARARTQPVDVRILRILSTVKCRQLGRLASHMWCVRISWGC